MHQWLERKIAPATKPRELRLRNESLPRAFHGNLPEKLPAGPPLKKPPSMLAEHKVMAVIFAVLLLGLAFYFAKSINSAPQRAVQPAAPSVYVEVLPSATDSQPNANKPGPPAGN